MFVVGSQTEVAQAVLAFTIYRTPIPPQLVTISGGSAVTEGTPASFTVTRIGDSAVALTMKLTVDDAANADSMASGNEGSKTVTVTDDTIYLQFRYDQQRHRHGER